MYLNTFRKEVARMLEHIWLTPLDSRELNIYQYGMEDCVPAHYFGPAVRDHFLIHFILGGKGTFRNRDAQFELVEGQGFLIFPNEITYYEADKCNPWRYAWIGFNGTKAEEYIKNTGLMSSNPIFNFSDKKLIVNYFTQMLDNKRHTIDGEMRLTGLLYLILSELIKQSSPYELQDNSLKVAEHYVKKAIEYIQGNYSRNMSVVEISEYIGLDRSYFGSVFRNVVNVSPQQFLLHFRINKACELLIKSSLSIGDISRSVGYGDQLLFSKTFKKIKRVSPKEYRKGN